MNKEVIEIKVEKIDSRCFIDEEIETLEKYTDKKTGRVLGYYKPEIHYAPHNAERITEEQFLKNLGIKKIKNNFEKIKQMTVDEMALWFCRNTACETCKFREYKDCSVENTYKQWLLQEVEE